ncbi:MAG: hypothetical protein KKC19_01100 [Nanoarchaeota archaeon]|nr:hypothetical protein [Nanoarchaeota archaeon]
MVQKVTGISEEFLEGVMKERRIFGYSLLRQLLQEGGYRLVNFDYSLLFSKSLGESCFEKNCLGKIELMCWGSDSYHDVRGYGVTEDMAIADACVNFLENQGELEKSLDD